MSDKATTEVAAPVENISRCWDGGFHAYMAGPCFDTIERATAYRDELDKEGVTWKSRRDYWDR